MITAECQQTRDLLDSYLSAELLVETNHQILRHLSGCKSCRAELARRHKLRVLMKAALPGEDPPPDLVRRISQIPRGHVGSGGAPIASRVRSVWHKFSLRGGSSAHRRMTTGRTGFRQAVATAAFAGAAIVLVMLAGWSPWAPVRVTASELLDRSDRAVRAMSHRSDTIVHRSLNLEERRGRKREVVARRRVEVWHNGASGVLFRRAFDERNVLVAAESLAADGARTVYRAGAPPKDRARPLEHSHLKGLEEADDNSAWRLDLSATEYASLIPTGASAFVEDAAEHYLLKYQGIPSGNGPAVVAATLKLRRDTLLPVEQTVVVERSGEVSEYALTEAEIQAVPRNLVPAAAFEPDAVLTARVNRVPSRLPEGVSALAAAPAVVPSLDTELDVVYRLHRVEGWLRDAVSITRTPQGTLDVSAIVASQERRRQLLSVLAPVTAAGVAIDVRVDPREAALPSRPHAPPDDVRTMAIYDQLRPGFADSMQMVPSAERPSPDQQDRLIDGLARKLAERNLERAHGALIRAIALERTLRQFSNRSSGQLSADAEATLQTMLRDHARSIGFRLEALRLELQPFLKIPRSIEKTEPPSAPQDLAYTAQQLAAAMSEINSAVVLSFGPRSEGRQPPDFSQPSLWRLIAEGERLAAIFREPLPLGAR
jgi:hypothetical protein